MTLPYLVAIIPYWPLTPLNTRNYTISGSTITVIRECTLQHAVSMLSTLIQAPNLANHPESIGNILTGSCESLATVWRLVLVAVEKDWGVREGKALWPCQASAAAWEGPFCIKKEGGGASRHSDVLYIIVGKTQASRWLGIASSWWYHYPLLYHIILYQCCSSLQFTLY